MSNCENKESLWMNVNDINFVLPCVISKPLEQRLHIIYYGTASNNIIIMEQINILFSKLHIKCDFQLLMEHIKLLINDDNLFLKIDDKLSSFKKNIIILRKYVVNKYNIIFNDNITPKFDHTDIFYLDGKKKCDGTNNQCLHRVFVWWEMRYTHKCTHNTSDNYYDCDPLILNHIFESDFSSDLILFKNNDK
jgi:hypothetical protein